MSELYRDQATATYPPTWSPPQTPTGPSATSPSNGVAVPVGAPGASPSGQSLPATTHRGDPIPGLDRRGRVRRTRVSGIWVRLIAAAFVLILLLVFILQNSQRVAIHFFGAAGHLSFAVGLLFAAACGLLLVGYLAPSASCNCAAPSGRTPSALRRGSSQALLRAGADVRSRTRDRDSCGLAVIEMRRALPLLWPGV
jgi:uncharacterized integral membrane protein